MRPQYSLIGIQKRSHRKLICREIKRATTDPRPRTKRLVELHPLVRKPKLCFYFLASYF